MGKSDSNLTTSLTWYANGTTQVSDSRGNSFNFVVPILSGVTSTLLQNSTTIDQKIVGVTSSYDIYWNAVTNKNGIVQTYKLTISGSSVNGTTLKYPISSHENIVSDRNELWATDASTGDFLSNDAIFRELGGIGINWADAIKEGYQVSFDSATSSIEVSVGKTFSVDPTVVTTGTSATSPSSGNYFEGEKRVVNIGGNLFAFYYNGSSIVYRNSTTNGNTWSTTPQKVWKGTGTLAQDSTNWTIGSTTYSGTPYISIVYWYGSGSNTIINYTRGYAAPNSGTITWTTPANLIPPLPNNSPNQCGGYACVAANEANDTSGNLFMTVRWLSPSTQTYHNQEYKSVNGGSTFTNSSSPYDTNDPLRTTDVLARLANGNMLLVQALYSNSYFNYFVYSSSNSSWHTPVSTSNAGMTANTIREISADSDTANSPYIAYDAGNATGVLKVARWTNSGTFNTFETADSTKSHALPSIVITRDNIKHVYSLVGSDVFETDKAGSVWSSPTDPFGSSFTSPDQLTAQIAYPGALWTTNSGSSYNLNYGVDSVPGAPTGLAATDISSSAINLVWNAPAINGSAVSGYKIERLNGNGTWTAIVPNTHDTAITYVDTGLSPSTTYTYRVSAINYIGTSSPSSTAYATTYGSSWTANTGIFEPLYIYPYPSTNWQPIINSHNAYPHVPFYVVVNPDSGPCFINCNSTNNPNPDYQRGIASLHNAGINVLGYVWTGYSQVHYNGSPTCCPYSVPSGNMTQWSEWYKPNGTNGIILDGMSNIANSGNLTYYQNLTNHKIHANFTYSMGNPGQETLPAFIGSVDKMNIYEGSNSSSNSCGNINKLDNATLQGFNITSTSCTPSQDNTGYPIDSWHTQYNKGNFSYIEFGQPSITKKQVQEITPWAGLLFITNDTCACYDHIPPYLNTTLGYLNNPTTLLYTQSFNGSNKNATITGLDELFYQGPNVSNYTLVRSNAFTPFTYNATQNWPYTIDALPFAVHSGNCMTPHNWVYNSINYSNPITITAPQSTTAALNVYYTNTNQPC